jgi:hypothetical protein
MVLSSSLAATASFLCAVNGRTNTTILNPYPLPSHRSMSAQQPGPNKQKWSKRLPHLAHRRPSLSSPPLHLPTPKPWSLTTTPQPNKSFINTVLPSSASAIYKLQSKSQLESSSAIAQAN